MDQARGPISSCCRIWREREPGKSPGGFDGIIEKLWNAGQPLENLIHANPGVLRLSCLRRGGAALDAEDKEGQDSELWDLDENEAEEMADFEDAHAPGGPPVEATVSRARKAATGNTPPKKTRTAAPADTAQGGAQSSQAQRFVSTSHVPKTRAHAIVAALASS